jgi:hypothetical protein
MIEEFEAMATERSTPKRLRKQPKKAPHKVHLTEADLQSLVRDAQLPSPALKRLRGGCVDNGLGGWICPNEIHLIVKAPK